MDSHAHADALRSWFDKLAQQNKLIIVEGAKDAAALRACGVRNAVMVLSKKPLYAVVEEAAEKTGDAIILTDFDKKGKELYGKLKKSLAAHGVRVDLFFREFLQAHTTLSHIEGLKTYVQKYINKPEP